MKFKELLKTIKFSVHSVELYDARPSADRIFYSGNPLDLSLSTYLEIEDTEVLDIKVKNEVMLIKLKFITM